MKLLDRYILREMLPPFFLSTALLLLVLYLQKLFRIADLIVAKGASPADVAEVLLYVLPGFLVVTIPMSLIVATLTAFSRMSSDCEITALRASRISLYRMVRPVFLFATVAFTATAATSLILVPAANVSLKTRLFNMVRSQAMLGLEPGVFSSSFNGMVLYVDRIETRDSLAGVFIFDERSAKDPYAVIAKRGKLLADPQSQNVSLALEDGVVHAPVRNGQAYTLMGFSSGRISLNLGQDAPGMTREDMGSRELAREIERLRREGKPAFLMESELHKRLSLPFACLILGLIGAPLGIRRTRSGKSAGIAVAIAVFLIYYVILGTATNLAENGKIRPLTAYWAPNFAMFAASLLFVVFRARELNFMVGSRIALRYYGLKERLHKARPRSGRGS
jgi:lipopolysaccharide export system permease protein